MSLVLSKIILIPTILQDQFKCYAIYLDKTNASQLILFFTTPRNHLADMLPLPTTAQLRGEVPYPAPGPPRPSPIVFRRHDARPNMRIQALNQDFHVHSFVLKSESEFFFKFLDSADKQPPPLFSAGFQYTWVTQIDPGGGWSLVANSAGGDNVRGFEFSTVIIIMLSKLTCLDE